MKDIHFTYVALGLCAVIETSVLFAVWKKFGFGWAIVITLFGGVCACRSHFLRVLKEEKSKL